MVDTGIDDQVRYLVHAIVADHVGQCVPQFSVSQLDAVLSLGREPAAIKTLRSYRQFIGFGGGPVEIFVHGLLGKPADDGW